MLPVDRGKALIDDVVTRIRRRPITPTSPVLN